MTRSRPTRSPITPAPRPTPPAVWALGVLALALVVLPVVSLGIRVPWSQLGQILSMSETRELLRVTVLSAVLATIVSLALGTPLALWLQRLRRGAYLARLLVLLPLALPPVVAGLALSAFLGRRGLASPLLDVLGWQFAFAFPGVVAAHVFIALPFVVLTLDAALRQLDPEVADSAAAVGIPPARTLRNIIVPAIAPSVITAAGLAFARSLGEFGTTLTFAGSMPGSTRTMPLGIYLAREVDQSHAYGLSAILIFLAVLALAATALPSLWPRRTAESKARITTPIDVDALRLLTRPDDGGLEVRIDDVAFPANATTALIGPNGAGKTTLAGRIAGRLTGASVRVGARVVDAPGARPVPAHARGVVLLTQTPGLPPTATVSTAITMVTGDAQRTSALLQAAGLAALAEVRVPALSGGQAAQVALVRALATRPRVLILDEPLASLDVDAAAQWREVLRAAAHDRTTVLITHDALDLYSLADHVAVMHGGHVVAVDRAADAFSAPASAFVARLCGVNLLPGVVSGGALRTAFGVVEGLVRDRDESSPTIRATFPPSALELVPDQSQAPSPAGHTVVLQARVRTVELLPSGDASVELAPRELDSPDDAALADYAVSLPVDRAEAVSTSLRPGAHVTCVLDATQVRWSPAH